MTISEQVSPKVSHQIEANGLSLSTPVRVPLPIDTQHLPKPPSVSERYAYLKPPKFWAVWGIFAYLCLLFSSCWFLWQTHFWWFATYVVLMTVWTLPHFVFVLASKDFSLEEHTQTVSECLPQGNPQSVDIFITTCGEDPQVIENTFYHASQLTYHPRQIYVLDDGASPEVKELAQKYGLIYLSRPNRGYLKKAGNLLYGYKQTWGNFILVLDADFAVAPCALEHMIPWVMRDSKIAILQTPQYFDFTPNLSWPALGAAYCQEAFYRAIQPARDYLGNSAICVGTNALYRREALEQIGGFYQVPASEDVHNGVALINAGWKIKYIPILLARGLCPESAQALFKQHYRWCSGSMGLITSRFFWEGQMPLWQKLIYLCGVCYYPAMALSLLVAMVKLWAVVWCLHEDIQWYVVFLSVPKVLLMYLIMPFWNQSRWGLHSIKVAVTFCWAYLIAIWDFLRQQTEGWTPSGSKEVSLRYLVFRQSLAIYSMVHVLLLLPIVSYDWHHFLPIIGGHCFAIFIALDILMSDP